MNWWVPSTAHGGWGGGRGSRLFCLPKRITAMRPKDNVCLSNNFIDRSNACFLKPGRPMFLQFVFLCIVSS